jgi:NAD-dependent dihydropyrimidine dehydrogenase PreA subunit
VALIFHCGLVVMRAVRFSQTRSYEEFAKMSYTIVADVCEGIGDCIPVCPVECIHWVEGKVNTKSTKYTYIDDSTCIDCGACLSVCPIEGAILDEWKPELQKP